MAAKDSTPDRRDKSASRLTQIDKFREAARRLKADESDEAYESALGKIAHAPKLTNEQIKELARRKRESEKD
ncbi:hypothetical protein RFN25_07050 [Mesorhizobium abyssinicae]|uniref:hypothetical protein n=1 Tax=Mesorhizobium abyssinicae TaxID=1209958 RepID=UPI002A23E2FC|nr:hypothetical protein [Mesorhizobium abyssinicae]MDX8433190.1 hypothetical protein [Mesorhizobium abyssinicae]